ncbi:hypothetical protein ARMGADRAFT_1028983 [Armillaria gallica]|uniref:Uncharacterized protein n=1 Tax=Armillaria gallica TaxID=47427 RepID=A0A2H3DH75_ARMGA|nr:hypothetical protein ARMGADRAFT_1028983 [Armillaria gallica]
MYCRAVGEARQAGNAQDNGRVSPVPSQGAICPCLFLFSTWDDDPSIFSPTILFQLQMTVTIQYLQSPPLTTPPHPAGYSFTVNAGANQRISVNVIGAISDILIAASPFISCSIPGTTCRRSGMMISKLDCVSTNLTLSSKPSLSKLVSLSLKPVFLQPAYPASEVNGSGNNVLEDRWRRGIPTLQASYLSLDLYSSASPPRIDVQRQRENELGKTQKWQASFITSVIEVCADSYCSHLWMLALYRAMGLDGINLEYDCYLLYGEVGGNEP